MFTRGCYISITPGSAIFPLHQGVLSRHYSQRGLKKRGPYFWRIQCTVLGDQYKGVNSHPPPTPTSLVCLHLTPKEPSFRKIYAYKMSILWIKVFKVEAVLKKRITHKIITMSIVLNPSTISLILLVSGLPTEQE